MIRHSKRRRKGGREEGRKGGERGRELKGVAKIVGQHVTWWTGCSK